MKLAIEDRLAHGRTAHTTYARENASTNNYTDQLYKV